MYWMRIYQTGNLICYLLKAKKFIIKYQYLKKLNGINQNTNTRIKYCVSNSLVPSFWKVNAMSPIWVEGIEKSYLILFFYNLFSLTSNFFICRYWLAQVHWCSKFIKHFFLFQTFFLFLCKYFFNSLLTFFSPE